MASTTSGSGVLDDILLSTKSNNASPASGGDIPPSDEELLRDDSPETVLTVKRADKRQRLLFHGVGSSDATGNTVPKHDNNSVHQKIDTLMSMMKDIAPVVKTLKEAYEDSLLAESDDENHDIDGTPPKQMKLATTTGASLGVVDSLYPR